MELTQRQKSYWHKNLRLTAMLLLIWFVATFVFSYYARELNAFTFLGFPLGFYFGAQGSMVVYVLIIGFYARAMNRLDAEYGVRDGEA